MDITVFLLIVILKQVLVKHNLFGIKQVLVKHNLFGIKQVLVKHNLFGIKQVLVKHLIRDKIYKYYKKHKIAKTTKIAKNDFIIIFHNQIIFSTVTMRVSAFLSMLFGMVLGELVRLRGGLLQLLMSHLPLLGLVGALCLVRRTFRLYLWRCLNFLPQRRPGTRRWRYYREVQAWVLGVLSLFILRGVVSSCLTFWLQHLLGTSLPMSMSRVTLLLVLRLTLGL